jgi:hypothetical protein
VLKDLLKLRPALARKEEQQRDDRLTDTSKPAKSATTETAARTT